MKTHTGEKSGLGSLQGSPGASPLWTVQYSVEKHFESNKYNQCNYSSLYASTLRTHVKTHTVEKSGLGSLQGSLGDSAFGDSVVQCAETR